jgi:hypothetical protein
MPGSSRLARLLQAACFAQLGAAAGWLAWRWTASPLQAITGAALIVFVGPLVLAIEFACLAAIARSNDGLPRPTFLGLARAWLAETLDLYRTFWWRQPFRWRAEPDHLGPHCAGRPGVVLVHGFVCNRGFWTPWLRHLHARGHAFVALNLEPVFGSIDDYVATIGEAVDRVHAATGFAPVLVAHSMGGLAARAWWRTAGTRQVAHIVTIASPHRGTWLGRFSRHANARQMHLRSDWLAQLASDEQRRPLPPTTCWYSDCDNIVFPVTTATLPNADNRFLPGQPHVSLAFRPEVLAATLDLIEQIGRRSSTCMFHRSDS